jgi:hypothetical protein
MLSNAKLPFFPTTSVRQENSNLRHRPLLAASLGRAIADLTLTAEAKILEFAPR